MRSISRLAQFTQHLLGTKTLKMLCFLFVCVPLRVITYKTLIAERNAEMQNAQEELVRITNQHNLHSLH